MQHHLLHFDERQYVTFSLKGQTTNTSQHVEFFHSLIFTSYFWFFQGSPDEIQDFLPIELNTMKNSAEDCLKYAKETEAAFDQVSTGGSRFSQKIINCSTCLKHLIKNENIWQPPHSNPSVDGLRSHVTSGTTVRLASSITTVGDRASTFSQRLSTRFMTLG